MSKIQPLIPALSEGQQCSYDDMYAAFSAILTGNEEPLLIAAFLMALRIKNESVSDLTASCTALQDVMTHITVAENAMDIVGTGGDGHHTLNISTTTAFVVAGAGMPVAKHGNRAASSLSGASDVLSALDLEINVDATKIASSLHNHQIAFLWAPLYHPGMKHVAGVRQTLKIPTIYNFSGPLCNPARVKKMLLGVARQDKLNIMVQTLRNSGYQSVWGVYGADGLDELSITGENQITELRNGEIREFTSHPEDVGLNIASLESIRGGTPAENAQALRALLQGEKSAYRDMVLYNAAAALLVGDKVDNLRDGVTMAAESIDSGAAENCLNGLISNNKA